MENEVEASQDNNYTVLLDLIKSTDKEVYENDNEVFNLILQGKDGIQENIQKIVDGSFSPCDGKEAGKQTFVEFKFDWAENVSKTVGQKNSPGVLRKSTSYSEKAGEIVGDGLMAVEEFLNDNYWFLKALALTSNGNENSEEVILQLLNMNLIFIENARFDKYKEKKATEEKEKERVLLLNNINKMDKILAQEEEIIEMQKEIIEIEQREALLYPEPVQEDRSIPVDMVDEWTAQMKEAGGLQAGDKVYKHVNLPPPMQLSSFFPSSPTVSKSKK